MIKLIAIASLILALLFPLPSEASQERQTGGWLIDSQTRVITSTDFIKTYRLSAQKITGYDFEGTPIAKNIAEVHVPFDPQLTALGLRHCKSEPSSNGIAAVYSVEKKLVKYAWIFDGKAFNKIPSSKVSCNRALLLD